MFVKSQIDALNRRIADLQNELPQYSERHPYRTQLQAEISQLQQRVSNLEQSYEYEQEQTIARMFERDAEEREFMARRQARKERIAAGQRVFDEQVNAIDWRIAHVPFIEDRRAIVRSHLAELNKRKASAALYADTATLEASIAEMGLTTVQASVLRGQIAERAALSFESKYTDPLTGRRFVVITDPDGVTWVDNDHSPVSDGRA